MIKNPEFPCGDIIVFTDGEENTAPSVASQAQYALDNVSSNQGTEKC